MFGLFQKMLGRRGGDQGDQERLEDPEVVDRMLEEKYHMPFEDFYYILESLEEHRLVEASYDWDEIYEDFGKWVKAAQKLGKLKKVDEEMWERVFP